MGRKAKSIGGMLFLALFSLPFAGVGVFMLWLSVNTVMQSREAAQWVETPCRILSVKLDSSRGSDSTTYQCVARYAYEFGGMSYESDRVSFSKGSDNIGSFQRNCVNTIKARKRDGTSHCYLQGNVLPFS